MRDMRNETMKVTMFGPEGETTAIIPVEVFRHSCQAHPDDMKPREVICIHCGKKHMFPDQSYKRIWWEPINCEFTVHLECPHEGCDGWYADFMDPDQY